MNQTILQSNQQQSISSWRRPLEQSQTSEQDEARQSRPLRSEQSVSVKSFQTVHNFTKFLPRQSRETLRNDTGPQEITETENYSIFNQEIKYGGERVQSGLNQIRPMLRLRHLKGKSLDQSIKNESSISHHKVEAIQSRNQAVNRRQRFNQGFKSAFIVNDRLVAANQSSHQTSQQINYNQIFLTSPKHQPLVIRSVQPSLFNKPQPKLKQKQTQINRLKSLLSQGSNFDPSQIPQQPPKAIGSLIFSTMPSSPQQCKKITLDGKGIHFNRMKHQQYQLFVRTMMDVKRDFEELLNKQASLRKNKKTDNISPHNVIKQFYHVY